jgi:toxin secretion/phage lysis holin
MKLQGTICTGIGIVGAFIASLYGGWTDGMTTLLMFMAIDYIMGLLVAGVWHKSKKTEDGCLESRAGWKGLVRKGVTMLIVLVAARLDMTIGTTMIRDTAVIGFIANEGISIIENAGLMGVPLPKVITNALEVLRKESENAKVPGTQETVMVDPEDPPVIHEENKTE